MKLIELIFVDFWMAKKGRLSTLAKFILSATSFFSLVGAVGYAMLTVKREFSIFAKAAFIEQSLSDMYPTYPTWWIPESYIGWFCIAVAFIFGLFLTFWGNKIDRFYSGKHS